MILQLAQRFLTDGFTFMTDAPLFHVLRPGQAARCNLACSPFISALQTGQDICFPVLCDGQCVFEMRR